MNFPRQDYFERSTQKVDRVFVFVQQNKELWRGKTRQPVISVSQGDKDRLTDADRYWKKSQNGIYLNQLLAKDEKKFLMLVGLPLVYDVAKRIIASEQQGRYRLPQPSEVWMLGVGLQNSLDEFNAFFPEVKAVPKFETYTTGGKAYTNTTVLPKDTNIGLNVPNFEMPLQDDSLKMYANAGDYKNATARGTVYHNVKQDSQFQHQFSEDEMKAVNEGLYKMKELCEENRELRDELEQLKSQRSEHLQQIAQLMQQKISEDETDLENISDANRPTKIREMYKSLTTNEWLMAKQSLEAKANKDGHLHHYFLALLLMTCHNRALVELDALEKEVAKLLQNPLNISRRRMEAESQPKPGKAMPAGKSQGVSTGAGGQKKPTRSDTDERTKQELLPKELGMALQRQLRSQSDDIDSSTCAQELLTLFMKEKTIPQTFRTKQVETYMASAFGLAWKMVLQTPRMTLFYPQEYDPQTCEPHMTSKDPKQYQMKHVVFPGLQHGPKLLEKAVVICCR